MQEDPSTGKEVPVTVRRFDHRLLPFILERRNHDYRERVENSGSVDIHVLIEKLNAGRRRVGEEKAEREAEEQTNRGGAASVPPQE